MPGESADSHYLASYANMFPARVIEQYVEPVDRLVSSCAVAPVGPRQSPVNELFGASVR